MRLQRFKKTFEKRIDRIKAVSHPLHHPAREGGRKKGRELFVKRSSIRVFIGKGEAVH